MVLLSVETSGRGWVGLFYPSWGSSAFYDALVAVGGYGSSTVAYWTILPGFPLMLHLIMIPLLDFGQVGLIAAFRTAWVVAVVISWILTTVAVPMFQSLAERAMSRTEAMNCALMMFFFPEVFVFSSLGFSSAFFLLLELLAWVMLSKKLYGGWVVAACWLSLTELCGIALSVMFAAEAIRLRMRRKNLIWCFMPLAAVLLWFGYVQVVSGYWMNVFGVGPFLVEYFSALLGFTALPVASGQVYFYPIVSSSLLCFVMIVAFLSFHVRKTDCVMGCYAISMALACAVLVPVGALPRLLSLIFPVWLNLRIRSIFLTGVVLAFFFLMSVPLWNGIVAGYLG
jgi:hypothetical protein